MGFYGSLRACNDEVGEPNKVGAQLLEGRIPIPHKRLPCLFEISFYVDAQNAAGELTTCSVRVNSLHPD